MKALKGLLRPLRAKILAERLLRSLLYTLAFGGVICGVITLLGRFIYSVAAWADTVCIAVMILSVAIGAVLAFRRRPDDLATARSGDALGYEERLVTALEILTKDEAPQGTERLVVEDTLKNVNGGELRRAYKIKPPKRALLCALCAAVFFVGSGFIPVPEKLAQQFAQRQELEDKISEEIEKLDEAVEEELENMPDEQRAEVEQRLEELKDELRSAESEDEAVEALERAQEDIQRIENETVEDLQTVDEALAQENAAGLGDALANGDITAVSEALQNADAETQAQAADTLNQAAEGLAEDSELGQALQDAADALQSGDSDEIAESLEELQEAYDNAAKGSSGTNGVNNAVSDAAKNIKGGQQDDSGQSGSQSDSSESGSSGSQSESGSQSGSSESGSSESQSGSGLQSSSGGTQSGSGSQSGSSGTQDGSGAGGSDSTGSGSGWGSGHIPDEQIYSRGAEDMAGYDAQLEGYEGEAGEYTTEERQAIGSSGEVPYSEVYNEYKEEALESLNDSSVPSGLQDIVREYFSTLE